ncbi:hypothetical protein QPK31_23685 [Massilia sp. YIM B02769]|uniref:hypothetical protein n=1 Tax=unclassified Massilia TaxID=2609279 RepID=UPI0025B682D3|nr:MULTISPECIES: hypothetical protein [unclassified Massilia]MDN4061226.1 hypothetical protein [Massilia sp. YIM B02769]
MPLRKYLCALALLPALLAPLAGQAAPLYTVTALPTGFNSYDINNLGQIAGYVQTELGGATYAALYAGGSIANLGSFGGNVGFARSLNDAGQVVGVSTTASGDFHGFLYSGGSLVDLGAGANAISLNARGDVVGQLSIAGGYTGFVYRGGSITQLGNLGTGDVGLAWDINDHGKIVGESSLSPELHAPFHPFLYKNGRLIDLGTLADRENNSARVINNAGRIAGYSEADGGGLHAFVYENGVMTDVGSFGGLNLDVSDINERGAFVGSASTWDGPTVGYISFGGELIDLNTLIDPASGWVISGASGINDLGQIVASACRDFECGSVRLDLVSAVPEPAMALMLLPGVVAVVGVRRRRMRRQEH